MRRSRAVGATGGAAGVAAADTISPTRTPWGVAFKPGVPRLGLGFGLRLGL